MNEQQWTVRSTEEYQEWFEALDGAAKEDIRAKVEVLGAIGPSLGRPQVDTLKGSRFSNMKELRVQSKKGRFESSSLSIRNVGPFF